MQAPAPSGAGACIFGSAPNFMGGCKLSIATRQINARRGATHSVNGRGGYANRPRIRPAAMRRDSVSASAEGDTPQAPAMGLTLSRHRKGSMFARHTARGKVAHPMGAGGGNAAPLPKTCAVGMHCARFHLATCQMKLVVSAPTGAAMFEPSRGRLKVSPTREGGG